MKTFCQTQINVCVSHATKFKRCINVVLTNAVSNVDQPTLYKRDFANVVSTSTNQSMLYPRLYHNVLLVIFDWQRGFCFRFFQLLAFRTEFESKIV